MTYLEEIKLTLANNECSIAENAYKKEEAERNLAKQIKELLDKDISNIDIANVIKLPIEELNSLLEKFYPQVPAKEQNSDIQSQLNFLKQQIQILQKKLENQEFENVQLKQQLNTIQAKGANMAENNEPIQTQEAPQEWEYTTAQNTTLETLNKLGKDGWRYVEGLGVADSPNGPKKPVFMRPKPKKKEPDYGYGR